MSQWRSLTQPGSMLATTRILINTLCDCPVCGQWRWSRLVKKSEGQVLAATNPGGCPLQITYNFIVNGSVDDSLQRGGRDVGAGGGVNSLSFRGSINDLVPPPPPNPIG